MSLSLDVLAVAAHRDDVEQTCGGLCLIKMAQQGYRTGILELTQAGMGTQGTSDSHKSNERRAVQRSLEFGPNQ